MVIYISSLYFHEDHQKRAEEPDTEPDIPGMSNSMFPDRDIP